MGQDHSRTAGSAGETAQGSAASAASQAVAVSIQQASLMARRLLGDPQVLLPFAHGGVLDKVPGWTVGRGVAEVMNGGTRTESVDVEIVFAEGLGYAVRERVSAPDTPSRDSFTVLPTPEALQEYCEGAGPDMMSQVARRAALDDAGRRWPPLTPDRGMRAITPSGGKSPDPSWLD
jgi:hypothetical protein